MNKAALADLEKIESIFYKRMEHFRQKNDMAQAELFQRQAETVRVCIVTVQAAENREPDNAETCPTPTCEA